LEAAALLEELCELGVVGEELLVEPSVVPGVGWVAAHFLGLIFLGFPFSGLSGRCGVIGLVVLVVFLFTLFVVVVVAIVVGLLEGPLDRGAKCNRVEIVSNLELLPHEGDVNAWGDLVALAQGALIEIFMEDVVDALDESRHHEGVVVCLLGHEHFLFF
jgi:hypothetical protein